MKSCPFCGGSIQAWQGHMDWTFFGCGDPATQVVDDEHCGAVISFRDKQSRGLRGSAAIAAFELRANEENVSSV